MNNQKQTRFMSTRYWAPIRRRTISEGGPFLEMVFHDELAKDREMAESLAQLGDKNSPTQAALYPVVRYARMELKEIPE